MRKGNQRIIFMVVMMALAILFMALWFASMENWFTTAGDTFINKLVK